MSSEQIDRISVPGRGTIRSSQHKVTRKGVEIPFFFEGNFQPTDRAAASNAASQAHRRVKRGVTIQGNTMTVTMITDAEFDNAVDADVDQIVTAVLKAIELELSRTPVVKGRTRTITDGSISNGHARAREDDPTLAAALRKLGG